LQKQKDEIRKEILRVSEEIFLKRGFLKTSMRHIAKGSNVGLSNIYNYFSNKDEIFREVLNPVINRMNEIIYKHKASDVSPEYFSDMEYHKKEVEEYMEMARKYRTKLKLLLFCSQGSSLSSFKVDFTNRMTKTITRFFKELKEKYPHININISAFFIHLNTSWLFTLLEELVMHDLKKKELKQFITEYISFEMAGWKELIKL
jgi:AcrR family transcriptional regulator